MSKKKESPANKATLGETEYSNDMGTGGYSASAANGKAPPLTPRERFVKYAERRVGIALKKLKYVQNMGARNSYEYTAEEATAIVLALEKAIEDVRRAFVGTTERRAVFTLF